MHEIPKVKLWESIRKQHIFPFRRPLLVDFFIIEQLKRPYTSWGDTQKDVLYSGAGILLVLCRSLAGEISLFLFECGRVWELKN